jgi:Rad3-related DNA helicase
MAVRMQRKADIVLLPTLLLFSPKSRGAFKFEITNTDFVINDEAHLSPDIACDACSLEVDLAKLKQFLREHLPCL